MDTVYKIYANIERETNKRSGEKDGRGAIWF